MKLYLTPDETLLEKPGEFKDGKWVISEEALRIDYLIKNVLKKIAYTDGGWDSLYRDPADYRYWDLTYPNSEHHGGGHRKLSCISRQDAEKKYKFLGANEKPLSSDETVLEHCCPFVNGELIDELDAQRIYYLTNNVLNKIDAVDKDTLYQDPNDGRYWELTYTRSKGWGPKKLAVIAKKHAAEKYKLPS